MLHSVRLNPLFYQCMSQHLKLTIKFLYISLCSTKSTAFFRRRTARSSTPCRRTILTTCNRLWAAMSGHLWTLCSSPTASPRASTIPKSVYRIGCSGCSLYREFIVHYSQCIYLNAWIYQKVHSSPQRVRTKSTGSSRSQMAASQCRRGLRAPCTYTLTVCISQIIFKCCLIQGPLPLTQK